ncbi:MAG: transposase [Deltaproteobacteria bacterium]|jgi:transposase|nr:transposase [Deltaproteobacteria bacterium]
MTLDSHRLVDMPKSGVVVCHIKNYHPVYMSVPGSGHRNAQGTPTKDRVCIGKLDQATGKLIPNAAYFVRFGDAASLELVPVYKSYRLIGGAFLVDVVMGRLGLIETLNEVLGLERSRLARMAALYMVARGNVFDSVIDYCETNTLFEAPLSSQMASRLFSGITHDERMAFFKRWAARQSPATFMAFDVTSFSTLAKGVATSEFGYNRDGERIPQINIGCYVSENSRLPVFYVTYNGSIVDHCALPSMMAYNAELGVSKASFVMDRGFCSTNNVKYMDSNGHDFIIGVEKRHKTPRMALELLRSELTKVANQIDSGLFAMSKKGCFYGTTSTMHVYYAQDLSDAQTDALFRSIDDEESRLAQKRKLTPMEAKEYSNHFAIVLSSDGSFTFKRDLDRIEQAAKHCGYFYLLSNTALDKVEVLAKYRQKNVIEKSFDDLKNYVSMKRLNTHNTETTDGKLFCAFIALIVTSEIEVKLGKFMRKKRIDKAGLFREMEKICVISNDKGWRLMNPVTKTQRTIMEEIGLNEKDLGAYLRKG